MDHAVRPRARRLAAMVALAALPFLAFWPLISGTGALPGAGQLETTYPIRRLVAQGWASGAAPLWDPYTGGGQPILAEPLAAPFYPPNILAGLLAWPFGFPLRTLELEALFHLSAAALFAFLLARELFASDAAAMAAGLVYSLGGHAAFYAVSHADAPAGLAGLPLILLFLEWAFRRGAVLFYVGAGAILGLCLLAGPPEAMLFPALGAGLYWLWRFASDRRSIHAAGLACMGLAAAAVSLPNILPALELSGLSAGLAATRTASEGILSPLDLWRLATAGPGGVPSYLVLTALALAPLGLASRATRGHAAFWIAAAALSVTAALAGTGLQARAPGLSLQPERALLVAGLAVALLAGGGVAAAARRAPWAGPGLVVALLALALWSPLLRPAAAAPAPALPPPPDGIAQLLRQAASSGPQFRVSSDGLLPGGPHAATYFRIEDTAGSDLATFLALQAELPTPLTHRLENVRFVVSRADLTDAGLTLVRRDGDLRLYQIADAMPRAWLVHRAVAADTSAAARQALSAPGFRVDRTAAVEEGPEADSRANPAPVRVARLAPGGMRLQVQAGAPGYVLISQNHTPGWLAFVDGRLSPVYRANGWQPAIYVGPGAHSILFFYAPSGLILGLLLSLACMALLVAVLRRLPSAAPESAA